MHYVIRIAGTGNISQTLSRGGRELLVTQMYLPGAAGAKNERDSLFMSTGAAAARRLLIGVPEPGMADALRFDIVLEAESG